MTRESNSLIPSLRVLHVIRDLEPESGGPSRSVPQLATALQQLNTVNSIMYLDRGRTTTKYSETIRSVPIRSHGFVRWSTGPENKLPVVEQLPNLRRYYDIVHLHGVWDRLVHTVALRAWKQDVPYLWAPRGMLEPWSLRQKYWKKKLAWLLYLRRDFQRAQRLHATSELEAVNLGNLHLKPRVFVAANGLDFPTDVPQRPPQTSQKVALFLSRIHPKKGLELLIQAWNQVRPLDWSCRIVGPSEPSYLASLQKLVANFNLSETIQFLPESADQAKWMHYRSADLFILPTYSENFGIVVAESLAMETPVITTTGTPWQELSTKQCGWCVAPTVEGIVSALRDATSLSDDQRKQMGNNGREWMQNNFAWKQIATRVRQEYQEILKS